jgi:RNA-splicing ligase RtcB
MLIDDLVDFHVDPIWFDGYGIEYFKTLLKRVGYDARRAINSLGTLDGGNHFIELVEARSDGSLWCVIHSGSRGPGASITEYWQAQATDRRAREWI